MSARPFGGGYQEFLPQRDTSVTDDLTVFLMYADTEERRDNPVEIVRNTLHEQFNFRVITNEEFGRGKDYQTRLFDALENCIFVLLVLEKVTPSLTFEFGISLSMQKPLIVMRSQDTAVEYQLQEFEPGKSAPSLKDQEKLKYVANLPGLTDDQIVVFKSDDPEDLITKMVLEMARHREAMTTEILRAGHKVPVNLYLRFLNYLRGDTRKLVLKEAMDRYPQEMSLWVMAGRIRLMENDLAGAARDFERAVELNPSDPGAYMEKGGAYYDLGQFEVAARDWDQAIQLQPVNPHAHYNKGNAVFYLDREDEAFQSYFTATEQKPGFVNALNNQASIQINRKNYRKAVELLQDAIERQPSYAFSYFNLARVYRGMGRPEEEIFKNLNQAARAAKSNLLMGHDIKRNTYCLFLVYAALGDRDEALVYLRKCSNYDLPLKSWGIANRIMSDELKNDPEFQALIATAR